jgi:hypothetical protein
MNWGMWMANGKDSGFRRNDPVRLGETPITHRSSPEG